MSIDPAHVRVARRVTAFWASVSRVDETGCWPWTGYQDDDGYGLFQWDGKMTPAHELALTFTTGERRLEGFDTCHSCNNPICCNPSHLRFDTRAGNMRDMVDSGRYDRSRAKLSFEDVETIRARLKAGARQKDLAEQYGVGRPFISMIKTGKRYK